MKKWLPAIFILAAALIFFGLFCVVLDDGVITPILFAISNLGA